MTTHELARVLLDAPEAPALAREERGGSLRTLALLAYVASQDDIDYAGLDEYGVSPGQAVIDAIEAEEP